MPASGGKTGKNYFAANKEALVMSGAIFMDAVENRAHNCCQLIANIMPFFNVCPPLIPQARRLKA